MAHFCLLCSFFPLLHLVWSFPDSLSSGNDKEPVLFLGTQRQLSSMTESSSVKEAMDKELPPFLGAINMLKLLVDKCCSLYEDIFEDGEKQSNCFLYIFATLWFVANVLQMIRYLNRLIYSGNKTKLYQSILLIEIRGFTFFLKCTTFQGY